MDYKNNTNTVLHWNYRGFTEFPIEYLRGGVAEITDIYLKENLISRIPSDICKLDNLESLYLSGNDITELPREISMLGRLKCLDLSGNRLRYVPDEIGDMGSLKFLILDENELREIPLRIAELRMLRYLSEARMMSCLTGQLKEDIIMHTGRQLVQDVEFLKQLPRPLLLQIGTKLRVVIFIAGDIIIKINTIGDSLFFIYKGTVAVYSESGKEVCHLEDGDFFGEIALIMKNRLRSASVVAVTNCELFQLNREDFESSVASYSSVYEDFKKIATTRLEKTTVLDEHNKSDIKMKARKRADSVSYQF
ncbi:unnamed protein product [Danaus chrysippus]|uniref:(African queen) hypothetical protein n=1 Tax=Danaus chrysippus TaxID=151541 RepID=A0A8J2VRQ2_9NEOP|nr:unnamed protein product [Danaus chrysippus]